MIAMPLGAAGWSTANRWMRKYRPSSHSKVVRPPRWVVAGVPGPNDPAANEASISHRPTSTSRRSSASGPPAGSLNGAQAGQQFFEPLAGVAHADLHVRCDHRVPVLDRLEAGDGAHQRAAVPRLQGGGLEHDVTGSSLELEGVHDRVG